jgi:hypothetical protein
MAFEFHAVGRPNQENLIDLCSEAITSPIPPLSKESLCAIASIRDNRLGTLVGSERFEAVKIFDALDRLPPIEGAKVQRVLKLLADNNFSFPEIERAASSLTAPEGKAHPYDRKDEFGYISLVAETSANGEKSNVKFSLDVQRAIREGQIAIAEISAAIWSIEDNAIRRNLIDDCCRIIPLRLEFDFTDVPQS